MGEEPRWQTPRSTRIRGSGPRSSSATDSLSRNEPAPPGVHLKSAAGHGHHTDGRVTAGANPVCRGQRGGACSGWGCGAGTPEGLDQRQEGRGGRGPGFLMLAHRGPTAPTPPQRACPLTLCAHQHHGHLAGVAEAAEAQKVVIHCLEADLILQAEHKHHCVHPGGKLGEGGRSRITTLTWHRRTLPLLPRM